MSCLIKAFVAWNEIHVASSLNFFLTILIYLALLYCTQSGVLGSNLFRDKDISVHNLLLCVLLWCCWPYKEFIPNSNAFHHVSKRYTFIKFILRQKKSEYLMTEREEEEEHLY
jgi:hypothetical protein